MKRIAVAASLLMAALTLQGELPFVENDYRKAVERARAANVPLFVEAWAPW